MEPDKPYIKWKGMVIHLIIRLIKKMLWYKNELYKHDLF